MKSNYRVITSEHFRIRDYLTDLWRFRSLVVIFAYRDIKVKYAQTLVGLGWTLFQPLLASIIYSFFFGYVLKWETEELPYPVYVLSGLLSWNFYSYIIFSGSTSIQDANSIIRKVYIPKTVFPLSKVLIAFVELILSLVLLIPLCAFYNVSISWKVIFAPIVLLFNTLIPLAIVFYISALSIKRKDLFHLIPYFVTFGIWFTPVFFSADLIPVEFRFLLSLNPMNAVVNAWRWSLFGEGSFEISWLLTGFFTIIFFIVSILFFNRRQENFVDFL